MDEKQIQSQLDFIVRRFQEAMSKVESLAKDVKAATDLANSFKSALDALPKVDADLFSQVKELNQKMADGFLLEKSRSNNLASDVKAIINNHNRLVNDFFDYKNYTSTIESKFGEINSKVPFFLTKDHLSNISNDIAQGKKAVDTKLDSLQSLNTGMVASYDKLRAFVQSLSDELSTLKENIRSLTQNISAFKSDFESFKRDVNSSQANMLNVINKNIADAISKTQNFEIPSYDKELNKFKDEMTIQMNAFIAESKKSKLQYDSKIAILEKKIADLQKGGNE